MGWLSKKDLASVQANVDKIDVGMAHTESPSTRRFYRISNILKGEGAEYQDFRNQVISLTGIPV